MNQQKKDQVDARDERLIRAQRTGHYQDNFTGGGVPMCLMNGRMVPLPGHLEAAKRRRAIMCDRMEVENG